MGCSTQGCGKALALVWLVCAGAAQADPAGWDRLPVDRLIVKFKPAATTGVARAMQNGSALPALERLNNRRQVHGTLLRRISDGSHVVQLDRSRSLADTAAIISDFILDPDVEYVEPDLRMFPAAVPTDPLFAQQWALQTSGVSINPAGAWNYTGGNGAVVAVLDTGVLPHADLLGNLLPGYDFVSDIFIGNDGNGRDSDAADPGDGVVAGACGEGVPEQDEVSSWHGTHVAGIVAAQGFNGIGGAGVAPGASILPVRVLGRCGGYTSDIIDAIRWSAGYSVSGVPANVHPANVINMSLSSSVPASCSQSYSSAINQVRSSGTVVVIAAGNSSANADSFPPGNCPAAMTVAATGRTGSRAAYSNFGSLVDIAAPGGSMQFFNDPNGILSTGNDGSLEPAADIYVNYQGTSMAAPHVAGVAALMFAANPDASAEQVESALRSSARGFPGSCVGCGAGLVDASAAVNLITGADTTQAIADLALVLKGNGGTFVEDKANPGQGTIQYIAEVSNNGPDRAEGLTLINVFPAAVVLESVVATQGSCNAAATQCALGDLATGQKASVTLRVRTGNDQAMEFQGQISQTVTDPNPANNYVVKKFGGALAALLLPLMLLWSRRRRLQRQQLPRQTDHQ